MSVHRSSIGDFRFPLTIHKRGIECERILGWYLWKRGYRTVLCQDIKTYHLLQHGDTLSRCKSPKNVVQNSKERELLFYYLAIQKEKVSVVFHMSTLILNFLIRLRNRDHDLRTNLAVQKGMIMGNVTGLAMMISRKVGGKYNPSNE